MIRASALLLTLGGVALAYLAASAALGVTDIGLAPDQRPLAIVFISLAQLGMVILTSATLASWACGRAILPRLTIRGSRQVPRFLPARPLGEVVKPMPPLLRLRAAVAVVIGGFFLLLLTVPIQTMLLVWLTRDPTLLLPIEQVMILGEAALAVLWLSYLVFRVVARRRGADKA